MITAARFLSLFFVALALGPAMGHLLELPNKMGLSRDEYLVVQQIYRGWALLGFVVIPALASTLALAVLVRRRQWEYSHAEGAILDLVALIGVIISVLSGRKP